MSTETFSVAVSGCRIIDKVSTKIYIVMEYCEGGDLGAVLKRCKKEGTCLEEEFVWKVFSQVRRRLER